MKDVFQKIYQMNYWENDESVSGHGSDLASTQTIRKILPDVFKKFHVKSVLDIPCGDFHWFKEMKLDIYYIGADIVPELIADNFKYNDKNHLFMMLDITEEMLPRADLILCRDLLGHFSNHDVQLALRNIKRSGAKYLLATTFPTRENPGDIKTGEWRPINLGWVWGLGNPELLINEQCGVPGYEDKALGLWEL